MRAEKTGRGKIKPFRNIRAISSFGHFEFNARGLVGNMHLSEGFGPLPTDVDINSLEDSDVRWHEVGPRDPYRIGEVDVLQVGFFYLDEYGRRQYEPKLDEPRCPRCNIPLAGMCDCFPEVVFTDRGTAYVNHKEKTVEEVKNWKLGVVK